ncbi:hypothetical protein DFH06DRAFT_1024240 [Mycena polygramma]|nr:hypothetical protein DFH06DRAFT_1024240 [Mycena polygramma]
MDSRQSPDQALNSLWGPLCTNSPSTYVYVEGIGSKTAAAGAGVFFGPSSPMNLSLVVPGPYFGTADRARVFAIHETLLAVSPGTTLVIFCSSKLVIRQLCYSAPKNLTLGWPGRDSDLFKDTIKLLASRHARTCFVHIDSNSDNKSKREAYSLAKTAAKLQAPKNGVNFQPTDVVFLPSIQPPMDLDGKHKVYTELPEITPPEAETLENGRQPHGR